MYEFVLNDAQAQGNYDALQLNIAAYDATSTAGASVTVNDDGSFSYDPGSLFDSLAAGESTTDTFTYTAQDAVGNQGTATVTLTINGANDDPTALGLSANTLDQSDGVDATVGTLSATDVDGSDSHSFALVAGAGDTDNGSFKIVGNELQAIDAAALAAGSYSVRIQADDGNGGLFADVFTIVVSDDVAPSTPVDANPEPNTVAEGAAVDTVIGLTAQSTDSPASAILYALTDDAGGRFKIHATTGVVSVADGTLLDYESATGHTVTVRATDAAGNQVTQNFSIDVTNVAPTANADSDSTGENASLNVAAGSGVLANDTDPNGFNGAAAVSAVDGSAGNVGGSVSGSAGGSFTLNADGSFDFDPGTDFDDLGVGQTRDTTVTYTLSDGSATDTATLTITVNGADDDPVADDESFTVLEGGTATEADLDSGSSLLDGDTDPDTGDTLTVNTTPVVDVSFGTLTLNSDGTFTYVHDGSENFTDGFTYELRDADGGTTDTGRVVITITPQNDVPTLVNPIPDQAATEEVAFNFTFAAGTFDDNDTGDTLSYSAQLTSGSTLPTWLNFDAGTRTFFGTPDDGDVGTLSIRVTATDGSSATVTDDFDLVIGGVNDAPVIGNNSLTLDAGDTVVLTAANLSATDVDDPDAGLVFTVSAISGGQFERLSAPGTAITGFTQAELTAGTIVFVDDGDAVLPSYSVTVGDGTDTDGPAPAAISFTPPTGITTPIDPPVTVDPPVIPPVVDPPVTPDPDPAPADPDPEPDPEPEPEPDEAPTDPEPPIDESGSDDTATAGTVDAVPVPDIDGAVATSPVQDLLRNLLLRPAALTATLVPGLAWRSSSLTH